MADRMSPSGGQKVDAQGNVTYDFEGHIRAQGVDLDAGESSSPPDDRRVRWLRRSDGAVVATLYAYQLANDSVLRLRAELAGKPNAETRLECADASGLAQIVTMLAPAASPRQQVRASATRESDGVVQDRTVIDSLARSAFPQLAGGPLNRLENSGVADLTIPNGVTEAAFGGIPHSLGRVPIEVQATLNSAPGNEARRFVWSADSFNDTTFRLVATQAAGAATTAARRCFVGWRAIG